MSFKILSRGSSFMKLQVAGSTGKKYDVKVNGVTKSNVDNGAVLTFNNLKPNVNYKVYVYVIPQEYGRVLVQNNSRKDALSLAEVRVFDFDNNLVSRDILNLSKIAQTDTAHGGVAVRAIDGKTSGHWPNGSVTHTNSGSTKYWYIEFRKPVTIKQVKIYNRTDCCAERLEGAQLILQDPSKRTIHRKTLSKSTIQTINFNP